jgi:hypothetical protein
VKSEKGGRRAIASPLLSHTPGHGAEHRLICIGGKPVAHPRPEARISGAQRTMRIIHATHHTCNPSTYILNNLQHSALLSGDSHENLILSAIYPQRLGTSGCSELRWVPVTMPIFLHQVLWGALSSLARRYGDVQAKGLGSHPS